MALYVHKYGGTSVGDISRIKNVAERIHKARQRGDDVVVVVSAMSGETNKLVALAQAVQERPNPREMDVLLSTGEQVTIALLAMALHFSHASFTLLSSPQVTFPSRYRYVQVVNPAHPTRNSDFDL